MKPIAKKHTLLLVVLLLCFKAFASDDEDSELTFEACFNGILVGVVLIVVGALLSQIKLIEGFGNIIRGIGFFIGGLGVLGIASLILTIALEAALYLALYAAGVAIVGFILYGVYVFLFQNKSKK